MSLNFGGINIGGTSGGGGGDNYLNVNASNLSSAGKKVFDGQWINSTYQIYSSEAVTNTSGKTQIIPIDLSSYLPNDEYSYEVKITWWAVSTNPTNVGEVTSLTFGCVHNIKDNSGAYLYLGMATKHKISSNVTLLDSSLGNSIIIVNSSRTFNLSIYNNSNGTFTDLAATSYKRVGTNQ